MSSPDVPAVPPAASVLNKERAMIIAAYGDVFGVEDDKRTPSQKLVLEDMARRGFLRRPTRHYLQTGGTDDRRTAENEGARVFHLDTLEAVHIAHVSARGGDASTKRKQRGKFPV